MKTRNDDCDISQGNIVDTAFAPNLLSRYRFVIDMASLKG
jgi:hypothetical protein